MHIPPPVIALALGTAMYFAADLTPMLGVPMPLRPVISGLLVVAGLSIAVSALAQFRRHRTTVNPLEPARASTLVTGGVFRVSRNPMYVGLLMVLVAWAYWLGNGAALGIALLFVPILNALQIAPEERALAEKFGDDYTEYTEATRRWL